MHRKTLLLLAIAYTVFISIFALDVFGEYQGFELLIALTMHLVPSFIMAGLILLTWKNKLYGSYGFLIAGIATVLFFKTYQDPIVFFLISGPPLLLGVLLYRSVNKKS